MVRHVPVTGRIDAELQNQLTSACLPWFNEDRQPKQLVAR
jgi:hypothetical protein